MENLRTPKMLLGNKDLRQEFGLGRDLATRLAERLPHVSSGMSGRGRRLLVHRADIERLLEKAKASDADLWELTREHSPASLRAWLMGGAAGAA